MGIFTNEGRQPLMNRDTAGKKPACGDFCAEELPHRLQYRLRFRMNNHKINDPHGDVYIGMKDIRIAKSGR
jgi:hypothetical protein